ncbi:hypothetical protein D3C78_1352650 [compost metagenome]
MFTRPGCRYHPLRMGARRRSDDYGINGRVIQHCLQIAMGLDAQTFRQPLRGPWQRIGHRGQYRARHTPRQRLCMETAHSSGTNQTNTQGLG